ncbi:phage terminase large subunit [Adlercreutzia sp. R25]|uniref:phage terminase large subunit n=1 Tax=Adlercreutzia shanghongiae TaxID=3111773 RepID=UPI002DC0152A|nr:phage terminase large subunit [Adlercreutzia sp. R25]MEC4272953.1 phage terminase large subunit [Adlercreutzia sp. R25]
MDNQILLDAIMAELEGARGAEPFEDALAVLAALAEESPVVEVAYARWVRETACDRVAWMADRGDGEGAERLLACVEELLRLNARADLDSYMLFTEWRRPPAKQFWRPRRHVLYEVCEGFQDLEDGRIEVLVVQLPPRVGKSTTGCFAMSWHMGRHPLDANLMSGYAEKLTDGFWTEVLDLVRDSDTYRFAEVFPDARLAGTSAKDSTIALVREGRFPTLQCRPIGGSNTGIVEVGQEGWLYCDDMVKELEEALSADRMDKLYAAYANQLRDRKLDGSKEVHVGTRWVPNDVIGKVIDHWAGDPRCRVIAIPALDERDETNFDYLYGLGFGTEYYRDQRRALCEEKMEHAWSAKYMADPFWVGGVMFPENDLKWYDELPEGEPDAVLAVCDTKDRGADYAVQPIGLVYGTEHYIVDITCDNGLPESIEPKLASALARHDVGLAQYESNSAGGRVADSVAARCRELGHAIDIRKKYSTENKETRILNDSMWIKAHCHFRRDSPDPEYRLAMQMLMRYTTEGKNRHDDVPDALSMYKRLASTVGVARLEAVRRPW